ncbi:MAG: hypothetical protein ACE37B_17525 [Ilumatobacter sp.]|jgi:hypothetical protein|uniref:hypothetical protein n=1 Tax=Ilumatobacter sp. TaxID=1967498 RepID=UPI00391A6FEC
MSGRPLTHPKRALLVAWLEGAPDVDDAIAEHVGHCTKCAGRLSELADADGREGGGDEDALADALREIYAPPPDLTQRVMNKIDERERADRELSLFLGLFSIGKDAAELFLPPDGDES